MQKRIYIPKNQREIDYIGNWVYKRTGGTFCPEISQVIALVNKEKILAAAVFEGYNGATLKVHIAIDNKHALTREFMYSLTRYAYTQMKVTKLIGLVDSTAKATIKVNEKWGFVEEGRVVNGTVNGDLVIMTMTKEQCNFFLE